MKVSLNKRARSSVSCNDRKTGCPMIYIVAYCRPEDFGDITITHFSNYESILDVEVEMYRRYGKVCILNIYGEPMTDENLEAIHNMPDYARGGDMNWILWLEEFAKARDAIRKKKEDNGKEV